MILPIVSILLVILAILIRRLEVFGLYNVCLIYSTSTRWHLNLDSMDSQNLYSSFEFPSEVCQVVSFSNLRIPLVAYLHKLRLSCQNPFGSSQTKTVPLQTKKPQTNQCKRSIFHIHQSHIKILHFHETNNSQIHNIQNPTSQRKGKQGEQQIYFWAKQPSSILAS